MSGSSCHYADSVAPSTTYPNVGDIIKLKDGKIGTVKFVGETPIAPTAMIGVELAAHSANTNDGSLGGRKYFECRSGYGHFANPSDIIENLGSIASSQAIKAGAYALLYGLEKQSGFNGKVVILKRFMVKLNRWKAKFVDSKQCIGVKEKHLKPINFAEHVQTENTNNATIRRQCRRSDGNKVATKFTRRADRCNRNTESKKQPAADKTGDKAVQPQGSSVTQSGITKLTMPYTSQVAPSTSRSSASHAISFNTGMKDHGDRNHKKCNTNKQKRKIIESEAARGGLGNEADKAAPAKKKRKLSQHGTSVEEV